MHRLLLLCCLTLWGCEFESQLLEDRECSSDADCSIGETCTLGFCALSNADTTLPDTSPADVGTDEGDVDRIACGDEMCGPGLACCPDSEDPDGERCAVISGDPNNCGACGQQCGTDQQCLAGACACPLGQEDCDANGTCETEILSSNEDCGGCGMACDTGLTCTDGVCACGGGQCDSGEVCCDDACQDTSSSAMHCGACGTACGAGESCVGGSCVCGSGAACGGGNVCCGEACVLPGHPSCACGTLSNCEPTEFCCAEVCQAVLTDPAHCGGCGSTCSGEEVCNAGTCGCPAATPNACSGNTCVNFLTDESNCGSCGTMCASGETCCSGTCVNTDSEPLHCGGCFQVDAGAERCDTNAQRCCSGDCQAFTDAAHCGGCGNDCRTHPGVVSGGGSTRCANNVCVYECEGFLDDCLASSGCETPTESDNANCGGCNIQCQGDENCSSGACRCPAGTPDSCPGNTCVALSSDESNCGTCGTVCASNQTCSGVCRVVLPTSDLVAHYTFEATSGAVVDSSPNNLDGAVAGGITRGTAGQVSNAFDFDGVAGSGVEVPDDALFAFGTVFTAEAWIRPDVCSNWNTVVVQEGAFLMTFDPSCNATNWVHVAGTGWVSHGTGATVTTGVWQHYAMSFDGSVIRTYINGLEVGTATSAAGSMSDVAGSLYMGRRPASAAQIYDGLIDEVKLWNHVLTEEEICASAGGTYTTGPAACALP